MPGSAACHHKEMTTMRTRTRTGGHAARDILIANDDLARLETLLRVLAGGRHPPGCGVALAGELRRARIVPRSELPADVVTMNATVRMHELGTGEEETYTLVYPDEADIEANRLSVLAPVGTALLGYRAGDVVEWPIPAGITRFRVEEVLFQPRSARGRAAG
jgi:regulator of nucleoside diphosphate kinase